MGTKTDPQTRKITLVEFDYGQTQSIFFNWTAGVWYVDFDAVYERIDPVYLAGVSAQSILLVGSVRRDGVQLTSVATVALVITTADSFYFDISDRRLYMRLTAAGDEPSRHAIIIGVTQGVSNAASYYNSVYYEPRLKSAPALTKSRDPFFFGRIAFGGGTIGIDNTDGAYDGLISAATSMFGSAVRVLQGFDTDAYASFAKMASGIISGAKVDSSLLTLSIVDKRKLLSRMIPNRTFDIGTYPYIHYDDLGKPIPLIYGSVKRVPCVCTNQDAVAPASFSFKVCDCTAHPIQDINNVYVNKVERFPASVDLVNGVFTLLQKSGTTTSTVAGKLVDATGGFLAAQVAVGDYIWNTTDSTHALVTSVDSATQLGVNNDVFPTGKAYKIYPYTPGVGMQVTATVSGYTSGGVLIQSAATVIVDLLTQYLAMPFGATYYSADFQGDTNIGIWIGTPIEIFSVIEDICASALTNFIVNDDGRFALRQYSAGRAISQTFYIDELMAPPTIEEDDTQILTSTTVQYDRDWSTGAFQTLHDVSQEATIFAKYGAYMERAFPTLLISPADAQTFSTLILSLAGKPIKRVTCDFKLQPIGRELMDFVVLPIFRQSGKVMLGNTTCEIISISKDLLAARITLIGRIV